MKTKEISEVKNFKSFDKTKIFYKMHTVLNGKGTILFLHGLGGNLRAWDIQLSYFQNIGYRTIAFDLRGHGLSDRPKNIKDYTLENFAKDIITFLENYPQKDVTIVGHCLGGMVTLKIAEYLKSKLKAIVLVSTSTDPFRSNKFYYKYFKYFHMIAKIPLKSPLPIGNIKQISFEKFCGTSDFDPRRILSDIFYTTLQSYLATSSYLATLKGGVVFSNITCPTLIIHGAKDRIFPVSAAYYLNKKIKTSKVVVFPTANHIIPINNPKELSDQIENYLGSI